MTEHSNPPPSPLPPRSPMPSSSGRFAPGWVPSEEDTSPVAVDWRASTGLRVARRTEAMVDKLSESVDTLSATIAAWQAEGKRRWEITGRLLWAVGVPVLVAVVLALGAYIAHFVATLHH